MANKNYLVTNQSTTEQAGSRALLLTDNAPANQAVVDKLVLLSQALAGVTPRDQDSQFVLPLLGIQADIFGLLLRGIATAANSTAVLLCLRSKKKTKKTNKPYSQCNTGSKEKALTLEQAGETQTSIILPNWNKTWTRPQIQRKDKLRPARKGPKNLNKART